MLQNDGPMQVINENIIVLIVLMTRKCLLYGLLFSHQKQAIIS